MNSGIKLLFKNFSYTFLANLFSMGVSALTILIIPRIVDVDIYGYIQLYIFYVSYTTYLNFGIPDGIYIRYGGKDYNTLEKGVFASQFWLINGLILVAALLTLSGMFRSGGNPNTTLIILWAFVSAIIVVPRTLLTFTLMTMNIIVEPSISMIIERFVYFIIVLVLIFAGVKSFEPYIYADLIGKLLSAFYIILKFPELIKLKGAGFGITLKEAWENIKVGIKIVGASIASISIIGAVRFAVSKAWGVGVFAKVSLSLSIANLFLIFINAVSVAIYPVICRSSLDKLKTIYPILDNILQLSLSIMLAFYFPIRVILSLWLPQYNESLTYMALLFPMCIFECKSALILNTYFKALRKEKYILISNLVALAASVILTFVSVVIFENITFAISTIPILLGIRTVYSEVIISKILNIKNLNEIIFEVGVSLFFVLCNWYVEGIKGFGLYLIGILVYVVLNRVKIMGMIKETVYLVDNRNNVEGIEL